MRKGFNIASIAGAVAMAVSGSSFGGSHPAFDQWTNTGGQITGYCQTGYGCDVIASGTGFVQFMAKNNDTGDTYVGTIVSEEIVTGTGTSQVKTAVFKDESYIKAVFSQGGSNTDTNGGIAAKQSIFESGVNTSDGVSFTSDVLLSTGTNFSDTTGASIQIGQKLDNGKYGSSGTAVTSGDDFVSDFMYQAKTDGSGVRNGFIMEIDQIAGLQTSTTADPTGADSANDVQSFTYRERAGSYTATGGVVAVTPDGIDASGNPVAGKGISYNANEDIKAVWLGQTVNVGMTDTTGTGLGGSFSYLSFENKGVTTGPVADMAIKTGDVAYAFDLTSSDGPDTTKVWPTTSPFNLTFQTGVDSSGNPILGNSSGAPTLADPSGGRL
ncbi:MAG: hypothetical protein OEZ43_17210 [Gammaproteobacteria bacterium]|nr:hypothetical protein [Gammaproteobacteria bacterium]